MSDFDERAAHRSKDYRGVQTGEMMQIKDLLSSLSSQGAGCVTRDVVPPGSIIAWEVML